MGLYLFLVVLGPGLDGQLGDLDLGVGNFGDLAIDDVLGVVERFNGAFETAEPWSHRGQIFDGFAIQKKMEILKECDR